MTADRSPLSADDVLDLFQMEDDHGAEVLARYVRTYPQFATRLIDFSRLIAEPAPEDDGTLSAIDQSRVDAAWIVHAAAAPAGPPAEDPLSALAGERSRALSLRLGVPRQVVTCFRERKVDPATVQGWVLRHLADELDVPLPHVIAAMGRPFGPSVGRSYKADGKPRAGGQVSFEEVLIDAGVSEADRARLLADEG